MRFVGKVIRGKREGTRIGFPTANLHVDHNIKPGIYAGFADLDPSDQNNLKDLNVLFYIPQDKKDLIECHILDFPKMDLYGREISIELIHKIRDVHEFSSLDEAARQIKIDEQTARDWFKENND